MFHRFRAVHDAAARGDDGVPAVQGQGLAFFDFVEGFESAGIDDFLEAHSFGALNEDVGIDVVAGEGFGEQDADGAFTYTGHSDQNDVVSLGHEISVARLDRVRRRRNGTLVCCLHVRKASSSWVLAYEPLCGAFDV